VDDKSGVQLGHGGFERWVLNFVHPVWSVLTPELFLHTQQMLAPLTTSRDGQFRTSGFDDGNSVYDSDAWIRFTDLGATIGPSSTFHRSHYSAVDGHRSTKRGTVV